MLSTHKRMQILALAFVVVAALFGAAPRPAQAQEPKTRTITVTGFGESSGVPDTAFISTGVEVVDADVSVAFGKANTQVAAVLAALRALNIDDKDIQTANMSLYSQLPPDASGPGGDQNRRIYVAQVMLNIRVRDAGMTADGSNRVSQVLDAAIKAGANILNGVSFGLSDTTKLLDDARSKAIADAGSRATKIAAELGVKLGKIVAFEEFPQGGPVPVADARYGMGGGGAQVNLGQLSASFQVRVVYEIAE